MMFNRKNPHTYYVLLNGSMCSTNCQPLLAIQVVSLLKDLKENLPAEQYVDVMVSTTEGAVLKTLFLNKDFSEHMLKSKLAISWEKRQLAEGFLRGATGYNIDLALAKHKQIIECEQLIEMVDQERPR